MINKHYYFSNDGSVRQETEYDIVVVTPKIGDLIHLYTFIDFGAYFPETSYISPDKTWCYINQYLIDIVESLNVDDSILVGKVVGIL